MRVQKRGRVPLSEMRDASFSGEFCPARVSYIACVYTALYAVQVLCVLCGCGLGESEQWTEIDNPCSQFRSELALYYVDH